MRLDTNRRGLCEDSCRVSFLMLEFIFNDCKADIILVTNSTGK